MSVFADIQNEIKTALDGLGFSPAPMVSGLPGSGQNIDGVYDWVISLMQGTETMQGPNIREHEDTLTIRIGHQGDPGAAPWMDLYQKHVERVAAIRSRLLNRGSYVPSATLLVQEGQAALNMAHDKQTAIAWSEIPFRLRWREN